MRPLPLIANSTPHDYLSHVPQNPEGVALMMIEKANRLFPIPQRDDGVQRETNYSFLFVGPGSGLVVQTLIDQGHRAYGIETSRRGIASGPEGSRSYVKWCLPWETPFPSMSGESPAPFKMFHITIVNKYLKQLLKPDEWEATTKELKKISKQVYGI